MKIYGMLLLTSHLGLAAVTEVPAGANLQAYVDAASSGDTLQLKANLTTNITVGKNLIIEGLPAVPGGSDRRELKAQDTTKSIIEIESPDPNSPISVELRNLFFRIEDDDPTLDGAGVRAVWAALAVEGCKFARAQSPGTLYARAARGCGISAIECDLEVVDTAFSVLAAVRGGAIFGSLSTINITDSTFYACADYDTMIPIEDNLVDAIETENEGQIENALNDLIDQGTSGGAIHVEVCDLTLKDCGSEGNAANQGGFIYAVRSTVHLGVLDGIGGGDSYYPNFDPPSRHYGSHATLGSFIHAYRSDVSIEDQIIYNPNSYMNDLGYGGVVNSSIMDLAAGTLDIQNSYLQLDNGNSIETLFLRPVRQGANILYTTILGFDLN